MNFLAWFMRDDLLWAWVTIVLSSMIIIGYCVTAINWYFQSKVSREESSWTLRRLRNICIVCAICGYVFYVAEMPWLVWRSYDAALLVFVCHTWWYVFRMSGPSLVNERLAQMHELERSATRYREIAELLPHMVWTATAEGRVDFSNQRWQEYAGDNRSWLDTIHPEEQPDALAQWTEAVLARQPLTLEARLCGLGGYRTFLVKATPIVRGEAVKWLGACADIEDQKRLAAEKDLQAKQKTFFLNALSHDLRAPLHNVVLNAHLLKMSAKDDEEAESVSMIMENAVAAGDLVTRLLDFAKVGAMEHNAMENVSLSAALQQVSRRFSPVAQEKGLYLRTVVDQDVHLFTDRQKVDRIVSNLVDNAIKYTNQGGVTIELRVLKTDISILVSDTGVGIPDTNAPYLFDEFYQVENYERDRSKGFGMGLAICRCLARHIGGDVRLASTGAEGSCFEFVIKKINSDRRGRRLSAQGDHTDPQAPRLCRV